MNRPATSTMPHCPITTSTRLAPSPLARLLSRARNLRKSPTRRSGGSGLFSGMYPSRIRTRIGFSKTQLPATRTVPEVAAMKVVMIRMVVLLPAPFGPRKPTTSPRPTENDTASSATCCP